jgi:two-component system, sensor histidine kinase YesM
MKLFSKIRYRHKVATVIFLFILLPFLALSMFIAKKSWDEKVNTILEQNKSELRIGVEAVNTLFLYGLQKLTFINNNSMFAAYLDKGDFSDFVNNMTVYNNMKRTIDALFIDNSEISFVIYPVNEDVNNGEYIEKLERLEKRLSKDESGILQQLLSLDWDKQLWLYEKEESAGDSYTSLGYIRCYKKMQSMGKTLAITQMSINTSKVLKCIEGNFPEGSYIVFKPDEQMDTVVIQKDHSSVDAHGWRIVADAQRRSEDYYPIEMKLNYSSGTFTVFIPRAHIFTELRSFLFFTFFLVVTSIFTLFLIVELASYLITRRLSRLIDRSNTNIENMSGWATLDRHSREDDLGMMEGKFYDMLDKIHEFYKRNMEHENEKKSLELELLQSRINPHFLYNTLSTMKWNCNNPKMENIIDAMVSYYRLALNKGDMIVKISYEMKLVEEFLKIQKYTYESDFVYVFDVDEEVKDFPTIRNLLQPVVENAVLHGINGLESGGRINLSGKLNGDIVTLTVSDNGVGMKEEKVQQLLDGEYKSKLGGYGIKSVQKRINLFYGVDSALDITSVPDEGTTVVITIPAGYPGKPMM